MVITCIHDVEDCAFTLVVNDAANNNIKLYNYINSTTWCGSTGIVLMDFVGAHTSGKHTVYGDLCPQAIIDNNYKYRMKRKGE